MLFPFVMFFDHLDDDCQGNDKGSIYSLGHIDGITIAEKGELAANLSQQVAIVVTHTEIPAPNIAVDVEDHPVAALDLNAFAEQTELLVHGCPMLSIAINFIARQQ